MKLRSLSMRYQSIVGKINEYLLEASVGLAKWLDNRLPKSHDWWNTLVLNKLSINQRTVAENNSSSTLGDLDLSSLLRIADRNWYVISQRFFLNHTERDRLISMFTVRNRWAHPSPEAVNVESIIEDLELIYNFCGQIDIDKTTLFNIEKYIKDVKTGGVNDLPEKQTQEIASNLVNISKSEDLKIGSIIHPKSNPSTTGVITSVDQVGNTIKYTVFINSTLKTFFADQVEPHEGQETKALTDIEDFRRILTAQQIKNPSSDSLYSLNSARIDFVPYQFRPVLKIIKSETPRLLIADSVGVGKTIEAGLVLKEMQMRSSLDTIIIICPKPLVAERKWEMEMREKFGEDFIPADSGILRQILLDYERDGVWDDRYKRLIIPYSILTDELLNGVSDRRYRPGLVSLDPPPIFDLLIVDEAHHIRNSNTQSHKVVKFFCEHSSAALFLTATPIQLGNQDLYTLLNLLFPDIVIDKASFEAMAEPNEYINEAVRFLRRGNDRYESAALTSLCKAVDTPWGHKVIESNPVYEKAKSMLEKGDLSREQRVSLINDIESLHSFSNMINRTRRQDIGDFCVRRPYTIKTDFTKRQQELHDELLEFEKNVLNVLHGNISAKFLMSTISRQASSCLFGLAPFIKDLVSKRMSELFDEYDEDLENINVNFGQFGESAKYLIEIAEKLPDEDPKFDALAKILSERQKPGGGKTIVFSSFRHTLNYLYKRIKKELSLRVEQVNGSIPDEERFNLRQRFALPKSDPNAIDVLLFTEVGSEGLDYQFCNAMINYDLPWNPMRIEQRIGRIDRRGQASETVHIYNCIVNGTIDADIYDRCFMRIGVFEQSLGECSDILGNIENSIKNIIFDSALTPEERSRKIEQMADNEIRLIYENRKLEEEEKEMFGLDISGFADDIAKAANPWITPDSIRRLVEGYLSKRLGENKHFFDNKLKLSSHEKLLLLDDYNEISDRTPDKIWEAYLKSGKDITQISYTQEEAKNNRKCLFITLSHPLARQASECYGLIGNTNISLSICTNEVTAGQYPFLLYSWEYKGLRPRVELIAVCNNEIIREEIVSLLQSAISSQTTLSNAESYLTELETKHHDMWRQEKDHFIDEIKSICRFKTESLKRSLDARIIIAKRQLSKTSDPKIERMRNAEIARLESDFEMKKKRIEDISKTADIHTMLLASGVLNVTEG